uniref:Uncharacterized protein n=1 Tax=Avena sativa TaxID=4498 RepID=A0ACD5YTG0_AVESA
MGRSPCCEKLGLKRGPWTAEEDMTLVAHIERHGHSNWRALPKQAGLLRCGKSCRLRWINYLRPDVKRGNFTGEEEDAIIQLHGMLGNRWSLIAARLPGRTDNEIKNVWHTHLKKRLEASSPSAAPKRKARKPVAVTTVPAALPEQPISSCATDYSMASSTTETTESFSPDSHEFQIDDSFWSETLAIEVDSSGRSGMVAPDPLVAGGANSMSSSNADMDFWVTLFMQAGDMENSPQI